MEPISIDASISEGGGQIFRNSMSLSVIMKRQLTIHSIRNNRPTPGLHNQALAVIRAIQSIFKGECSGASLGSTEVVFAPPSDDNSSHGVTSVRRVVEDVGSAGSLTLVLQALLPCVVLSGCYKDADITLLGGTNVNFSPPVEHFLRVLLPLLSHMGVSVKADLLKRGFYPKGGGKLCISSASIISEEGGSNNLKPITLTSQGTITRAAIYVCVSPEDCSLLDNTNGAQNILIEAEQSLKNGLFNAVTDMLSNVSNVVGNIPIQFENVMDIQMSSTLPPPPLNSSSDSQTQSHSAGKSKEGTVKDVDDIPNNGGGNGGGGGKQNVSGKKQKVIHGKGVKQNHPKKQYQSGKKIAITLGATVCLYTDTGCVITASDMMNEKDYRKFDESKSSAATCGIIGMIMSRLERSVRSGACIDEQTSDQLLIYMALAVGKSEILCAPFCEFDHSLHIEAAIDVISQFTNRQFTIEVDPETKCRLISCESCESI